MTSLSAFIGIPVWLGRFGLERIMFYCLSQSQLSMNSNVVLRNQLSQKAYQFHSCFCFLWKNFEACHYGQVSQAVLCPGESGLN